MDGELLLTMAGSGYGYVIYAGNDGECSGGLCGCSSAKTRRIAAVVDYFFNTASPIIPEDGTVCLGERDGDQDIDGTDLFDLIDTSDFGNLYELAANFGSLCP